MYRCTYRDRGGYGDGSDFVPIVTTAGMGMSVVIYLSYKVVRRISVPVLTGSVDLVRFATNAVYCWLVFWRRYCSVYLLYA